MLQWVGCGGGGWLVVMVGGCWRWLVVMLGGCCVCLLRLLLDIEDRVRESLTMQGRGERKQKIIYKVIVIVHIYTVTIAILHICKVMQSFTSTDGSYFMLYCVNFCTFCILHPLVWMLLDSRIPLLQYLLCYDYRKWTKLRKEWLEKTSSYNETPYVGITR